MNRYRKLLTLLTPSWIVNVVGVSAGALVPFAVVALTNYRTSDLKLQVLNAQPTNGSLTTSNAYTSIADNLSNNQVLNGAPLFLVWAAVGLGVYYLTIAIVNALGEVAELRDELDYVHVSRSELVHQAVWHFVTRAVAALGWFLFIKFSLSVIVPYALALSSIAALNVSLASIGYVILAGIIIYADIYVHSLFMRLIALKPRLFG